MKRAKSTGYKKEQENCELGGLVLTKDSWEEGQVRKDVAFAAKVTPPMPTIVEEIGEFTRCIRTEELPEIGGDVALRNLAVVLAAVESAKSGGTVEVASLLSK